MDDDKNFQFSLVESHQKPREPKKKKKEAAATATRIPSELLRVITWVCVDPHPRSRNPPVSTPAVTPSTTSQGQIPELSNQSLRRSPLRRKNQRRRQHPLFHHVSTNERTSSDAFSPSIKREIQKSTSTFAASQNFFTEHFINHHHSGPLFHAPITRRCRVL